MAAAGRNVNVFRRYFPAWNRLVFAYPAGWQPTGSATMDSTALEHLENLAGRLNDFVPVLNPNSLDDIRGYADGIRDLLDEDDSLDDLLKLHVKQVIAHLNWCIDNYGAVGEFDLQEAVERLLAATVRATAQSSRKERWIATAWNEVVWPFGVHMIAAIPATALAQLALGH